MLKLTLYIRKGVTFTAAQFIIAKCWRQSKCPSVNEWVKKLRYIYTME